MSDRKAHMGSISHGTLRPEDTIPAFLDELRRLRGAVPKPLWLAAWACLHNSTVMDNDGLDVANSLIDALDEHAPPYCYFGAHQGDGSDFGFWLLENWQEYFRETEGLEVKDTSEVPKTYNGEVLHVNDHGNATLYVARKGKLTEVWSVV